MAHLPSYEEAVTGGHWLDLVAPYVALQDYSKLCRVSRRFYDQFAPRLWNDPLQTARLLGLHPNDGAFFFSSSLLSLYLLFSLLSVVFLLHNRCWDPLFFFHDVSLPCLLGETQTIGLLQLAPPVHFRYQCALPEHFVVDRGRLF